MNRTHTWLVAALWIALATAVLAGGEGFECDFDSPEAQKAIFKGELDQGKDGGQCATAKSNAYYCTVEIKLPEPMPYSDDLVLEFDHKSGGTAASMGFQLRTPGNKKTLLGGTKRADEWTHSKKKVTDMNPVHKSKVPVEAGDLIEKIVIYTRNTSKEATTEHTLSVDNVRLYRP